MTKYANTTRSERRNHAFPHKIKYPTNQFNSNNATIDERHYFALAKDWNFDGRRCRYNVHCTVIEMGCHCSNACQIFNLIVFHEYFSSITHCTLFPFSRQFIATQIFSLAMNWIYSYTIFTDIIRFNTHTGCNAISH